MGRVKESVTRPFFLKVSDLIGQKEPSFAFIAVGACKVLKVPQLAQHQLITFCKDFLDKIAGQDSELLRTIFG